MFNISEHIFSNIYNFTVRSNTISDGTSQNRLISLWKHSGFLKMKFITFLSKLDGFFPNGIYILAKSSTPERRKNEEWMAALEKLSVFK